MEYSNDSQTTPPYFELLEFLDMQAQYFESVSSERKPLMTMHRSYKATVERECMACGKGGNHALGTCRKFQGKSREKQWVVIKKAALCNNCLSQSTLWASVAHVQCAMEDNSMEDDPKMEKTKKVCKEVTYVAPSKRTEEVLLMIS